VYAVFANALTIVARACCTIDVMVVVLSSNSLFERLDNRTFDLTCQRSTVEEVFQVIAFVQLINTDG
jgi:hypothetical protein